MSPRDWIEIAVLLILTITGIGRWIEAREQKEKQLAERLNAPTPLVPVNGLLATRADLATYEARHAEEHKRLWDEIQRGRTHWHDELVPWQQRIAERVAIVEAIVHTIGQDINRLERRRLADEP